MSGDVKQPLQVGRAYPARPSQEWLERNRQSVIAAAENLAEERKRREEEKVKTIEFYAEVAKVQTMADGGVRVVLDLGEDGRRVMEALSECKQNGVVLKVEARVS